MPVWAAGIAALLAACCMHALASDPLTQVSRMYIDYQAKAEIPDCKKSIATQMARQGISVVSSTAQANAIYRIKLDVRQRTVRSSIHWRAELADLDGKRLFSDSGVESSWSAAGACKDLADDLAENLKKAIRNTRLKRP